MKPSQRLSIFLLTCLCLITLLSVGPAFAQAPAPKFDEYLSALAQQGRFSGAALVARDGKVLFAKGYGLANREFDVPNTVQTKFRIGSITKQFTAAAIMLLQERGKLSVSDPICKYFSDCPPAWSEITVHHLLTHTSGIPSFTDSPEYVKNMHAPVTNESLLARFKDKPLQFKPGESWRYNNSAYFMLGIIIEKISGESYETFLEKNLFAPLQMTNTGYDHHTTILKNRATGYSLQNGKPINSLYLDMSQPGGAGALYSTVEDLSRWNEALFGDKLLSAKSREAMTTVVKNDYGYGLTMNRVHNRAMVSHGGGINGFNTFLARFPAERVNLVVLRNVDYGAPSPGKINQDLAAILFGEKYEIPAAVTEIKVDPKVLDSYVGQYELAPGAIFTIARSGDGLTAQLTGQPPIPIFAESETKFFAKVVEAKISFVRDDKGQATQLILHQGGDKPAKRIK